MKKVVYTLNIDNYAPDLCQITYPFLRHYAHKIGARLQIISERKFPDWPVTAEKLQIYELGRDNDISIYIDSDALVHPDFWDPTELVPKDTVLHNGQDFAPNRWRMDNYFRRDGRMTGSCNWFAAASGWCLDLWHPLDDLTLAEALENIFPTANEVASQEPKRGLDGQPIKNEDGSFIMQEKTVITPEHLIDDYVLSRNIAKYGLKHTTIMNIQHQRADTGNYLWHAYTISIPEKVRQIKEVMKLWNIENFVTRHS
jgi:hypothetical protein